MAASHEKKVLKRECLLSGTVQHISDASQYASMIKKGSVVACYSASWCPPCQMIKPKYKAMAAEFKDITFLHIDVDECRDIAGKEGIRGMPTFHFFMNGQRQDSLMVRGANEPKIRESLSQIKPKKIAFAGEGHRLGGDTPPVGDAPPQAGDDDQTPDPNAKPKPRVNPWADPDFGKKKMEIITPTSNRAKQSKKKKKALRTADDILAGGAATAPVQKEKAKLVKTQAVVTKPVQSAAKPGSQYTAEIAQIRSMGYAPSEFSDEDVKEALIACKGDIGAAIDEMTELD